MTLAAVDQCSTQQTYNTWLRQCVDWQQVPQHMTLLMCDLVDSTRLVTSLSTERFGQLMLDYYAACFDKIEARRGRVIRVVGDAVLGLFDRHETLAQRAEGAVQAAIALSGLMAELALPEARLALRVSIVSGSGIKARLQSPLDGFQQDVVLGELPFLASRLKDWARPGDIVVSERTANLVRDRCALANIGIIRPKGFSEAFTVWRVELGQASQAPCAGVA